MFKPNLSELISIGEAYIGGTCPSADQDGMIIKANTSGSVDTLWQTSGAIPCISVGSYIKSAIFYDDTVLILGKTDVDVNGTIVLNSIFLFS